MSEHQEGPGSLDAKKSILALQHNNKWNMTKPFQHAISRRKHLLEIQPYAMRVQRTHRGQGISRQVIIMTLGLQF